VTVLHVLSTQPAWALQPYLDLVADLLEQAIEYQEWDTVRAAMPVLRKGPDFVDQLGVTLMDAIMFEEPPDAGLTYELKRFCIDIFIVWRTCPC
jgi:hypothetical protein